MLILVRLQEQYVSILVYQMSVHTKNKALRFQLALKQIQTMYIKRILWLHILFADLPTFQLGNT